MIGKQRSDRRGGVGIGARQPELHREQRGLDREDDHQKHRRNPDQRSVLDRDILQPQRKIGDVQRAGAGVEHAQGEEKQGRTGKVDDHVLQTRPHPLAAAAMNHQAVGCDQQDFEENEQVERVAGQEGAGNTHQLELEQGMEMPPAGIPARGDRVGEYDQRKHAGQQNHHRRQAVEHENDAERRRPIAEPVVLRLAASGKKGEAQGDGNNGDTARDGGDTRQNDVVAHDVADERRQHGRQDDRRNDPVVHSAVSSGSAAFWGLSRSIRSLSDSRNALSATITSTAVIPNEITMAVRTSACGSGSV